MVRPFVNKKKRKTKASNPFAGALKADLNGTETKLLDNSKVVPEDN